MFPRPSIFSYFSSFGSTVIYVDCLNRNILLLLLFVLNKFCYMVINITLAYSLYYFYYHLLGFDYSTTN